MCFYEYMDWTMGYSIRKSIILLLVLLALVICLRQKTEWPNLHQPCIRRTPLWLGYASPQNMICVGPLYALYTLYRSMHCFPLQTDVCSCTWQYSDIVNELTRVNLLSTLSLRVCMKLFPKGGMSLMDVSKFDESSISVGTGEIWFTWNQTKNDRTLNKITYIIKRQMKNTEVKIWKVFQTIVWQIINICYQIWSHFVVIVVVGFV